jgi:hypothetical protein
VSLLNVITELKKACNHPFLFESAEDEYRCAPACGNSCFLLWSLVCKPFSGCWFAVACVSYAYADSQGR